MNKLHINLLATIIVIVVYFFLGRLIFLANAQNELEQGKERLQQSTLLLAERNAELEKLKKTVKTDTLPTSSNKILKPGEETSILRFILDNSGNSFKLNSFELLESFRVKTDSEEDMNASAGFSGSSEVLPELDEQGMPIGMAVESDEEWPGIEIIPIRMTFSTTYLTLGSLLSEAATKLPMNAVRSMDLLLSTTIKGTLVMTFPVAEQQKK